MIQRQSFQLIRRAFLLSISMFFWTGCGQNSDTSSTPPQEVLPPDSLAEVLQEVDKQFDTLSGNWVNALYLAEIKKTGSAFMSQHKMLPITEIILNEETGQADLHYGYQESCSGKMSRQENVLEIAGCGAAEIESIRLEYDPFTKELLYYADELTFKFVRLSNEPQLAGQAVQSQYLLNGLMGTWQAAQAIKPFGGKLQFDTRGFVKGISAYNKFKFVLNYTGDPAFMDLILLYRGANSYDSWYWQLDGDSLRFYSYIPEAPDIFEEVGVYYHLP